ncbi:hypothetical protein [Massilia sp. DWR3-1-1]|uniref:hypothetical protein n=1 Tax=Massilia sp. DWR3-1-1 TaxID=2804559 RepID=UPI003CEF886A
MKTIKNFEALFLVVAATATFATYATAAMPVRVHAAPAIIKSVELAPQMQVVVIKGQRLTAAEKAAL